MPERKRKRASNKRRHAQDEDEAEVQRGGGGAQEEKQKATGTAAAGDPNHPYRAEDEGYRQRQTNQVQTMEDSSSMEGCAGVGSSEEQLLSEEGHAEAEITEAVCVGQTQDVVIRTLQVLWSIPGELVTLREVQGSLLLAYQKDLHRRVHFSPVFSAEKEIYVDCYCFSKARPRWQLRMQALHHCNGQNYIALFLTRREDSVIPAPTSGTLTAPAGGGFNFDKNDFRLPSFTVRCSYELEIVNLDGVSLCNREGPFRQFAANDSVGWSTFTPHSQALNNNPGANLLVRCTIKILSYKPCTFRLRIGTTPSSPPTPMPEPVIPLTGSQATPDLTLGHENITEKGPAYTGKLRIDAAIKKLKARHPDFNFPTKSLKIWCKGQAYFVDVMPLAARSKLLFNLLRKRVDISASSDPSLILEDEEPHVVASMLQYLCTDSCPVLKTQRQAGGDDVVRARARVGAKLELLSGAVRFGINQLRQDLLDQLLSTQAQTLEVATVLHVVYALSSLELLADKTQEPYKILEDFVITHRKEIAETPEFQANPTECRMLLLQFLI